MREYAGVDTDRRLYQAPSPTLNRTKRATLTGREHDSGGNDSSWGYNGAWRWQVCWLAWFAFAGTSTSTAMRTQATQRANNIINSNFVTHPGFNV